MRPVTDVIVGRRMVRHPQQSDQMAPAFDTEPLHQGAQKRPAVAERAKREGHAAGCRGWQGQRERVRELAPLDELDGQVRPGD